MYTNTEVHKDQRKNGSCNKKSLSDSTTTTHVLHTTISTQTEYLCSSRSTNSEKCCTSCRGCFCEHCQGREVGDQGDDDGKQDVHYNSRSLSSHSEQKTRKLCNHDHDQENFSVSEMSSSSTCTKDLLEHYPSAPQNSVVGEATATLDSSIGMMHPHHQHHHQHPRHHQPQPQRPQRISFRKEGQPPTPNQQNRSNRNPVLGDSSKVTIIVAKDSGDVLL